MEPTERLINLIAFLLDCGQPVTATHLRETVSGYGSDQSDEAFQRMFERDKQELRELGIPLVVTEDDGGEAAYTIDRAAYYLPPIHVDYDEALALRLASTLLSSDPGYPLGQEIRAALSKLACDCVPPESNLPAMTVRVAPEAQDESIASNLAALRDAVEKRKAASFEYRSIRSGQTAERCIEPYGLFNSNGHWYVVGHCRASDAVRTFRLSRIRGPVAVNHRLPQQPDFSVPPDFHLTEHIRESWEFGDKDFEALVRFDRSLASWAIRALPGRERPAASDDGSVVITLRCRDEERLLKWVMSFGRGAEILSPASLRAAALERLTAVLDLYRGAAS